ncbi:hypothetical protein Pse7367_3844 (plasmid) [Thalassoporum mexicanum PCC 7367]|uniref:hypothetical protein n=1 Tax=Thalassoporum mexicanum TaxID=3457544 RepID=UPI0002A00126|nr:hypothetical protein [Pseudanabaena sp. PCC 7367]AFY72067.1 hypothetical protein Pse7367_3844 [Pseudanabaena sp. PCC 7367]
MATLNQKIQQQLDALPGDQVKAALKRWLDISDADLTALEQALWEEQEAIAAVDTMMESQKFIQEFPILTEEQKIQRSLEAHADYEKNGGIANAEIEAWISNLPN